MNKNSNPQKTDIRNLITIARGTRFQEIEDNIVIFGYKDLQYWNITSQSWMSLSNDNDKFLVICDDIDTAITEFFARWKIYVNRRFKLSFVKIENI